MLNILEKVNYAFPKRIDAPVVPGNQNSFLCEECINSSDFKITCSIHGAIQDLYKNGAPPVCVSCENELKQILNWNLPAGYFFILQADSADLANGKKIVKPQLVISNRLEVFVIAKKVISSDFLENICLDISYDHKNLILLVKPSQSSNIKTCRILVNRSTIPKSYGPWITFWASAIQSKLGIRKSATQCFLASVQHYQVPKSSFKQKIDSQDCICAIENNQIKTYPQINTPSLDRVFSWKARSTEWEKIIELNYKTEGIPEKCIIRHIPGVFEGNILEELQKRIESVPQSDSFEVDNKGIFSLYFPIKDEEKKVLLDLQFDKIIASFSEEDGAISFPFYLNYNYKCLLISKECSEIGLLSLSQESFDEVSAKLIKISDLFSDDHHKVGVYFDSRTTAKISILELYEKGFSINGASFKYSDIQDIGLKGKESGIFEVSLKIGNQVNNKTFELIAPEEYAFNTKKALELHKIGHNAQLHSAADLYYAYNDLKKYNLLTGIFSDVILLNRELNLDKSMKDLAKQLGHIDANQLFEDKKLYAITQKKILMLSMLLPKIKQNFEYLASYYPYYHLKNEIDLMAGAFGNAVAQKMLPGERKRIIPSARGNIRSVQSKIQIIISEIERAVYPIEQLLSKEDLRNTISNKILKYFPHGGQAVLIGTLVVTGSATGGVGLIAGMLGIRTLNDILNYFKNDRETAAQIKKAFEKVYPWWQLLEDTIPVALFEAAEAIEEDNNHSVNRDSEILNQFPKEKQTEMTDKMKNVLHQKIQEGTESKFAEILEGSGIRFESLISEIETVIDDKLPDAIENITKSFALPRLTSTEEKTNG
ncbi:MAG: hypothetical protein ACOCPM_06955 [Bacteroidales bacterium]